MYGSGSTPDCQLGYNDPAHMCGRDCSKEHSPSKRSVSFNSKSRSPTSSSRSGSLSPTDSVEQRLLPLSVINSSSRRLLMASNDRELENSGQSWGSRTTASSYTTPIGDINSDYHGFVGDEDPTFSIISRVSVSSGRLWLFCFVGAQSVSFDLFVWVQANACLNHHEHPSWVLFGFLVVSSSNWSWYNYVCLIRWVVLCDVVAQLCVWCV